MQQQLTHTDRIAALKAEIEALEAETLHELTEKRGALIQELAGIDAQIEGYVGKPAKAQRAPRRARKQISFELLKATLRELPGKTMNIRREGYDSRQIKSLIVANPESLLLGGKGAWPTVALVQ